MTDIPAQYSNQNQVAQPPAMGLIAQGAVFWKPDYLAASPWLEHLPMLFWLVEAIQPRNTVSLHAGSGVQHFAICQAVDRLRTDANCYAFDSAFQENVYERNENYVAFSQCIEMGPLDAAGQFSQETVDLLLLDGTSSELEQEVEAWLPLMSPNAVMVILGTARRGEGQYGRRLFETLSRKYPTLAFSHGGGVGVVVVGSSPRLLIARLLEIADNGGGIQVAREVFARLGRACHDAWLAADRETRFTALQKSLQTQEQSVQVLTKRYESVKEDLARREKETADLSRRIEQQVNRNAHERGTLAQRVTVLEEVKEALEVELERLKQQLNEAKQIAEQKAQQILALQAERSQQDLTLEKERFQGQYRAEELASIKAQLASTTDSLLAEQARINSFQENLHNERLAHESAQGELKLDHARLTQTLAVELKQREALEENLKAQQDMIAALTSEKLALQKTLNQEKQQTKALTEQAQINAQEHANQVKSLEEFHADRLEQIESQFAQNEQTLLARLQYKEQSLNDLEIKHQSAIQALQNELKGSDQAHRELLARMDTAQALVADLESKLQAQSTELETCAQAHAKQLEELERAHAYQLNEREVSHQEALKTLQGEFAGKDAAYAELAARLEVSQALVADLESKLQSQTSELEIRAQAHVKQLTELEQAHISQLNELDVSHQEALEALHGEVAGKEAAYAELAARLEVSQALVADLELKLQSQSTELEARSLAHARQLEELDQLQTWQINELETTHKQALEALQGELASKDEAYAEVVAGLESSRTLVSDLEANLHAQAAELESINEAHAKQLEELDQLQTWQINELETVHRNALEALKEELASSHQETLDNLTRQISDKDLSLQDLETRLVSEKKRTSELAYKERELQGTLDAITRQLETKSEEIVVLTHMLEEANATHTSELDQARSQMGAQLKELETQLQMQADASARKVKEIEAAHQQALGQLNKSLADKNASSRELESQLRAEKDNVVKLTSKARDLQSQFDALSKKLNTKSSEITELQDKLKTQTDIAAKQAKLVKDLEQTHTKQIKALEASHQKALDELNKDLADKAAVVQSIQAELDAEKASRSELSQAVIGLQKNLDLVQQRLESKSAEIVVLTQMNEEAETVHATEISNQKRQIHSLEEQVKRLTKEVSQHQDTFAQLERRIVIERGFKARFEKSLAQKDKELTGVLEQVKSLRATAVQRQNALVSLRTSERKLAAALEEKNRELAGLTRILDDLVNEKSKGQTVTRAALSTSSSVGTGWFSGGKRKREEQRLVALIEKSDQFQADWYLKNYPDVANHEVFSSSPARHYLKFGGFEGRNPGPNFDSERYLQDHPELRIAKVNPLVHFLSSQ